LLTVLLAVSLGAVFLAPVAAGKGSLPTSTRMIPGQYIVVLKDGTDANGVVDAHRRDYGADVFLIYHHALGGYAARLSAGALAAVRSDPAVLFVAEDEFVTAAAEVPQFLPRGVDRIDGERSSTRSGDGRGSVAINVAVLDSGIDATHPELNVVGGTNCVNDKGGFGDPEGHGTMVAGIIGARDNDTGVVGLVPDARLWAVRVLDRKLSGTASQIICGIDYVTSSRTDGDPSNDIAVANVSLGGKGSDDGACGTLKKDPVHVAICASVAAGVTYVMAAGNSAADLQDFMPPSYDEVLTVTAVADYDGLPGGHAPIDSRCPVGPDDSAAVFSNFATLSSDEAHTVAAPGACIPSTFPGGLYALASGTSFAAPHGTGTVALCIASGPCAGLTPGQIIEKIVSDAASYNAAHPGYGFSGDPLHAVDPGKYYGFLLRAALY
jgi:subtilisin